MSEEGDSRNATLGKKRAFNNTNTVSIDLLSSSDSSDGEPVQKRLKQNSSQWQDGASQSAAIGGEQKDIISLLSDESDSYASAEPGGVSDNDQVVKSPVANTSQRPHDSYHTESTSQDQTPQSQDDSDVEFLSGEEDNSTAQGIADTAHTILPQVQEGNRVSTGSGVLPHSKPAAAVNGRSLSSHGGNVVAQGVVHIAKVPSNATEEDLLTLFKDYEAQKAELHCNTQRGKKASGYGFVYLPTEDDAKRAIVALNGKDFLGSGAVLAPGKQSVATKSAKDMEKTASKKNPIIPLTAVDAAVRKVLGSGKKLERLRESFGDEYLEAVRTAVAEKSVHPILLSQEHRSCSPLGPNGPSLLLPDMMANNAPLPFSEISIDTYTPLFLITNPRHALSLVKRPSLVTEGLKLTIQIQYRHVPTKVKNKLRDTIDPYDKVAISVLLMTEMAKSMPETFAGLVQKDFDGQTPMGKAIRSAFEGIRLKSVMATNRESTKKPDSGKQKTMEVTAALSSRSLSKSKAGGVSAEVSAPGHDMRLHESNHQPDPEDDALQMRYYPPSALSSSRRCMICGTTHHRTQECGPITCDSCGQVEVHFTWACPQDVCCRRCQEQGHSQNDCLEKLKRTKDETIQCELCKSLGHLEWVCPRLWRSYEAPATVRKVAGLRIYCAICGGDGHYGNDCHFRSKRPAPASHAFSMTDAQQYIDHNSKHRALDAGKDYSIKKIKGFASKDRVRIKTANNDSDGDDEGCFLGPPVKKPQPARGHIQINNSSFGRDPGPSVSQSFSRDPVPHSYRSRSVRGRVSPPPVCNDYTSRRDEHAYSIRDGRYRDATDHYGGQSFKINHGNRSVAFPDEDGPKGIGPRLRGGGGYRGGNASKGGNASRNGIAARGNRRSRP